METSFRAGFVAQLVEYKHKAASLIPVTHKLDMVGQACNPTSPGVEAQELGLSVLLSYRVSFQASQG